MAPVPDRPVPVRPIPDRPIIRGERVWLRPVESAEMLDGSIEDADLAHYAGFRRSFSRTETEHFLQQLVAAEDTVNFAICQLGSDQMIGFCGLRDINRVDGSAEVAIHLGDPATWGQGLGTDAMRALVDFGFGELRLERIWLRVFDYNERAIRSYEKVGFVKEVLLRHDRFHRGAFHDVHLMGIIRPDWEADDRRRSWDY